MAQTLTEQAVLLREFGLRPWEIAASIYNIPNWRKLPLDTRRRLVWRVTRLLRYAEGRLSNKSMNDCPTNGMSNELVIDQSGGVRNLDQWSPETDGTFSIVERKKMAICDREKYMMEYERLLFFVYERVFYDMDDYARSIWNRIKVTHNYLFEKYWDRTHRKLVFNKDRIPEVAAAYVYIVFFAALYNTVFFFSKRSVLLSLLDNFVRDKDLFRKKVEELLPLIKDFIV